MVSCSTPKHPVKLLVEALESRLTPSTTTYVQGLYQEVLNRAGSAAEVDAWVNVLRVLQRNTDNNGNNNGNNNQSTLSTAQLDQEILQPNSAALTRVASTFWLSPEHRGLQVDSYYMNYLGRTESASERQAWVNLFSSGGISEVQVQTAFLSSPEYLSQHPLNTAYVQALYLDVLGRAADPAGQTAWENALKSGVSPGNVALGILTSPEGARVRVNEDYTTLLNRTADPAGLAAWSNALQDNDLGDTDNFNGLGFGTNNNNNDHDHNDDNDNGNFDEVNNGAFSGGSNNFVNNINGSGASAEEVAIRLLTSQEFIQTH